MKWRSTLASGIEQLFDELRKNHSESGVLWGHTSKTPQRVVESYNELFIGCYQNPSDPLKEALFPANNLDQMITTKEITIYSMCAHHLLPFFGHATFSYIPDKHIVGLSKIPRSIEILCRRPQIQEYLSQEIVDVFWDTVNPKGCAVMIRAYHLCNLMRGAEEHAAYTETTALRGVFRSEAKAEFLQTAQDTPVWGHK